MCATGHTSPSPLAHWCLVGYATPMINAPQNIDTDAVFQAYVNCALWSSPVEEDYGAANDMAADVSLESAGFGPDSIDDASLNSMRADVNDFLTGADPAALAFWADEHGDDAIGHDFWLTRNGHGAGFWDRYVSDPGATFGRVLTAMAKPYGESYLQVCADDVIYVA